jgi:hypothetical protein
MTRSLYPERPAMRMSRSVLRTLFLSASLLGLAACGGDGGAGDAPSDGDGGTATDKDASGGGRADGGGADGGGASDPGSLDFSKAIYPLTTGSSWTYRVTEADGTTNEKTVTAEAEETVGGDGPHAADKAVKLVSDRGAELTVSWVHSDGERVVRYREQVLDSATSAVESEEAYDPERVIADVTSEHRSAGASWLEIFSTTSTNLKKGTPAETAEVRETWQVVSAAEEVTVPAGTFTAIVLQKSGTTKQKQYWFVPGVGKVKETGGQTEELSKYSIAN